MLQNGTTGIGEVIGKRTSTTSHAHLIVATTIGNLPNLSGRLRSVSHLSSDSMAFGFPLVVAKHNGVFPN
jgi:hypothetical protein